MSLLDSPVQPVPNPYLRLGEISLQMINRNETTPADPYMANALCYAQWDLVLTPAVAALTGDEVYQCLDSFVTAGTQRRLTSSFAARIPSEQPVTAESLAAFITRFHEFAVALDKAIDRLKIDSEAQLLTIFRYLASRSRGSDVSHKILSKKIEALPIGTRDLDAEIIEQYQNIKSIGWGLKGIEVSEIRRRIETRLGIYQPQAEEAVQDEPTFAIDETKFAPMRACYAEIDRCLKLAADWIDGGARFPPHAIREWELRHGQTYRGYQNQGDRLLFDSFVPPPPAELMALTPLPSDKPNCSSEGWLLALMRERTSVSLTDLAWYESLESAALKCRDLRLDASWSRNSVAHRGVLTLAGGDESLIDLLLSARSSAPTGKWLKQAEALIAKQGEAIRQALEGWLELLVGATRNPQSNGVLKKAWMHVELEKAFSENSNPLEQAHSQLMSQRVFCQPHSNFSHPCILSDHNDPVARGAAWLLSLFPDARSVRLLRSLAPSLLVKLPDGMGVKYRSLIGVNACIWALGRIATPQAVAALGQIKLKIRDERLAKQIGKAMVEAAERAGMTVDELEEVSVPSFGLEAGGQREAELAGFPVRLAIETTSRVTLEVLKPDGSAYKTPPAAIKSDAEANAEWKQLQAEAADIQAALPVQRLRLERSWLSGRGWSAEHWHERLHDHPLMGFFTRRLVWRATAPDDAVRDLLPQGEGFVGIDGQTVEPPRPDERLSLWHPLQATPAELDAWRARIMAVEIVQPIRQAFRETYVLTPAEAATETYSNRFAGHILRQHQSMALGKLRGWRVTHRMNVDAPNNEPTRLEMPEQGLRAEFWTEGAGEEMSDSQAYTYISTDRTVFHRLDVAGTGFAKGERVPLASVPAVVFSEVMRDIDLMVGVASIGNDPNWLDRGVDAVHPNQWDLGALDYARDYGYGELAETAKQRRAVLALLLPKLAIADRCTLEERFLAVQGRLRSYKIHLGSGNILIDGDRYLCIVPEGKARPDAKPIYLPFEGDSMLSLILSKAALLAADDKIKDPSILRQLGR